MYEVKLHPFNCAKRSSSEWNLIEYSATSNLQEFKVLSGKNLRSDEFESTKAHWMEEFFISARRLAAQSTWNSFPTIVWIKFPFEYFTARRRMESTWVWNECVFRERIYYSGFLFPSDNLLLSMIFYISALAFPLPPPSTYCSLDVASLDSHIFEQSRVLNFHCRLLAINCLKVTPSREKLGRWIQLYVAPVTKTKCLSLFISISRRNSNTKA